MHVEISEKQSFARELEAAIGRVRAVVAARLVSDADDNVETIHVLATRARTADQIAADIEAVCAAMFNLNIDRRRVRISQPDEPDDEERHVESVRLELFSLSIESGRGSCRITVKLRAGDALYEGAKRGPDVVSMRTRLAALATIEAIEQFHVDRARRAAQATFPRTKAPSSPSTSPTANSPADLPKGKDRTVERFSAGRVAGPMVFSFNELQELTIGPWRALVASLLVNSRDDRGSAAGTSEEWLIGCALVRKDPPEAAVRAVLDAVNRRLFYDYPDGPSN